MYKHEQLCETVNIDGWTDSGSVGAAQIAVYVMAGGGLIGKSAAEQPAGFYVDSRVSRRPYKLRDIYAAVRVLVRMAEAAGLDPRNLPPMPRFHNLSVF